MGFCGSKDDAMSVAKGVLLNTCFVDVLNMIPHALLALICIFVLTVWNHSVMGKIKVKTWVHFPGHNIRWIATLALFFLNIVQIAEGVISDSNDRDTVNYHTFIPQCTVTVGTIVSIVFYHNVEMWNSPKFLLVLMIYWPSAITLKVLKAFSLYKNNLTLEYLKPWLLWMAILAYLILFIVELNILRVQRYYFFKRPRLQQPPEDLEHTRYAHSYVNFLSKAVFWWVTELMVEGYKHPLQSEDLGRLPESEQAQTQFKKLIFAFEEEKFKASQKNKEPSLYKSYMRAFWPMLVLAGLYRLIGDCLSFVGPVIIQYIVDYAYDITDPEYQARNLTQSKAIPYVTVDQFVWNGYVLAVVLFLATVLQHTFYQNHNYLVYREGIRLRTAIQTLVYDKALRLSSIAMSSGKMTIGQIMNHMVVDSMFLMHMIFFIHYVWSIPFQLVVTLVILYFKLGWSAVIGGLLVVMCGPLIYVMGVAVSRVQKKVMLNSDVRVKKVNELIQGMKIIKLLGWEKLFADKINQSRDKELHHLFPLLVLRALIGFLGMAAPALGALLTFVIYPHLESEPLTAGRTFSTLALFNLLSTPLQLLTISAAFFANAKVSGARLVPYLLAQEVEGAHVTRVKMHSVGIDTTEDENKQTTFVQYDTQTGLPLTTLSKDEAFCSSQSSLGSHISHTPGHSRQNSGTSLLDIFDNKRLSLTHNASSEYLSVKPLALVRKSSAPLIGVNQNESTTERRRKRNHSGFSTEEEDEVADEFFLIELRSVVEISHGNFSWDPVAEDTICLKNINTKVPVGKLTVIVGPVGSGKSSLLAAMLGEMVTKSGSVDWKRYTGIAYAAQRPWLLNETVRDNILFGNPFLWRRYKKVLSACQLQTEVDLLPAGDLTEIGEKGVTLSGGQKQRVSLARAMYADADTVILDDPFSALDPHVGRHVFDEGIQRRLLRRKRTVILVTHQLQYIGNATQVIVMKEGSIQYQGRPGDVKKVDPDMYETWRKAIKESKPLENKVSKEPDVDNDRKSSWTTERPSSVQSNLSLPVFSRQVSRSQMSVMTEASNEDRNEEEGTDKTKSEDADTPEDAGKLIQKEHREEGAVMLHVYLYYLRACCTMLCLLTLLLQMLHHCLMVSAHFSLSIWASDANRFELNITHHPHPNISTPTFKSTPYLTSYASLTISAVLGSLFSVIILYFTGLQGARSLFRSMLNNVIHLHMRFFDTNPSGRILNRFTADVASLDQKISASFEGTLRCLLYTIAAIVVNSITTPYFLFAAIPLVIIYYFLQRFFRNTARELQRLDSVTKSPVYSHFGETLAGLQTVRAYKCQKAFRRKAFATIDSNVSPFLYIHTINRWLGIRLDYLGCLLVFLSAIASLSAGALGNTNPAFIGLCITYTLMISSLLNWMVRMTTEVEMNMNSVERVKEYSELSTELHSAKSGISVPETWPEKGQIEFKDICLRYDSTLEDVVHHATFSVKPGEKIGICGRTGSGKSSLALSLFRALEISSGEITIDDKDICRVDLSILRSRLSIIPQDPVLFNGSIRYNLDPIGAYSEDMLWSALDTVHLRETVAALPQKLDCTVSEGGDNFSVGQRQLLCLARALLRDTRIVILDEATASIDLETDALLQQIVHEEKFRDKTVLTIAHRIKTISGYDRVMVLDRGMIMEFDEPNLLLESEESMYAALVNETNK